jgi:hypothetical protein
VGSVSVESCAVSGFAGRGIYMAGPGLLNVKNTDVKGCAFGIEISNGAGAVRASIDHCHLDGNGEGFFADTVSPGSSTTTVTNSTANNNSDAGWLCGVANTGIDFLNLESCSGSENFSIGLATLSGNASSAARYSNCVFSNNGSFGVSNIGSGVLQTRSNNTLTGNGTAPTNGTVTTFPAM